MSKHSNCENDTSARSRLFGYGLTVLLSSALLLVLEIVAGRLLAPWIGVSLYTWTSIIGVILAGLSLGNWLGGVWADRGGSGRSVGTVLGLAGLYCILSLIGIDTLGSRLQEAEASLLSASFALAAALFFLPAVFIGIVTPLLTTLALRLDARAGHVVGRMHALAAVGSILGTFAAGYWLVQWIGSRALVLMCGILLMLLAVPFLRGARRSTQTALSLAVSVALAGLLLSHGLAGSCERESRYFCMRVVEQPTPPEAGPTRGLVLDHLLHGINHRTEPSLLVAPYVHALDELAAAHFGERYAEGLRWFFAGGGAYSLPRAVESLSPDSSITVAELDPLVTLTAVESLGLDPAPMHIVHRDARLALQSEAEPFDVIVGDVFHDVAIPPHLVTREFAALVRERLAPDGLYLMNVVDTLPDPLLIKSLINTLQTAFAQVDIWMDHVPEAERVTFVISATNGTPLPDTIIARHGFVRRWQRMTDAVLGYGRDPRELPILTDDYAPVERLIAGLLIGESQ
ncbi:fused MFS/spermidine synthase [Thiorhodovibrio winogradskyi]|nr:fused MFS/spermidine synthase [Thiorhodovibrio winogradskyi]